MRKTRNICRCTDYDCETCSRRAERKAKAFLADHLTPLQRQAFKAPAKHSNPHIVITGNVTGDQYKLFATSWVERIRDGHGFCLDVNDENSVEVPEPDAVLAKKLLIECDEARFLGVAVEGD